jgi:hypothetical protein
MTMWGDQQRLALYCAIVTAARVVPPGRSKRVIRALEALILPPQWLLADLDTHPVQAPPEPGDG